MPLAHHVVLGMYGFWLPNDPRGSWSTYVGSGCLYRHGGVTKTLETRSVAPRPHDRISRLGAKADLMRPPVRLDGEMAWCVARGFADVIQASSVVVHACAILPEHVHLVVTQLDRPIGRWVAMMKHAGTRSLRQGRRGHGRSDTSSIWSRGFWDVYLDQDDDVRRAVRYVEENPVNAGLPRQSWSFVTPIGRANVDPGPRDVMPAINVANSADPEARCSHRG